MAVVVFYFAWVDATETTFGPEHMREDEKVISFTIEHDEGDFPALTVVLRNPRIGLLAPARKTWAWLSHGSEPLFLGRIIGVPSSINQEAVTLEFTARPVDYSDQKEALAATLRVLPFYDPVFLTPEAQADPDTVLEARPEMWHIDRVSLEVTTSHILVGEDGVEEFFENEVPYDSVQIQIGQVPTRTLSVSGDVSWTQAASGGFDVGTYFFDTYSGKSLVDDWPKPGDTIDGGYTVTVGYALDNYNIDNASTQTSSVSWSNPASQHASGDTLSSSIGSTTVTLRGPFVQIPLTFGSTSGGSEASFSSTALIVPRWAISARLAVAYSANRARKESVEFSMSAHFQALLTLPGEEEFSSLAIGGGDVGIPLLDSSVPIGDVRNRSYFSSDRGLRSLEYLINRGRAQLMASGRAVEISWDCTFERIKAMSCRKDAFLHDHRLPGGQAVGKVVKYSITADGDSGRLIGNVTINCSIGYGGAVAPAPGDPTYVENGYVDVGYQFYENQIVALDAGDIGYTVPIDAPNDDGIHFPLARSQAIMLNLRHGSVDSQEAALNAFASSFQVPDLSGIRGTQEEINAILNRSDEVPKQVEAMLKTNSVWQEIKFRNLNGGPFETLYSIDITQLELPQGINLEAGSTP